METSTLAARLAPMSLVVTFTLGDERYGVDVSCIREIIRPVAVTALPAARPGILGVIDLRERIVPVVDLRRRLGFDACPPTEQTRILVAEMNERLVGFVVDCVWEVLRIDPSTVDDALASAAAGSVHVVPAVARLDDGLLLLLDLDQVAGAPSPLPAAA